MRSTRIALAFALALSGTALAAPADVKYEIVLTRDGKVVASPVALGEFGKAVTLEVGGAMKVEALAEKPDAQGNSSTTVKFQLFEKGKMTSPEEALLMSDTSRSANFEWAVPNTNAKFTFKQTSAKAAAPKK